MLHNQLDPSAYGHGFTNFHRDGGGSAAVLTLIKALRHAALRTAAAIASLRKSAAAKSTANI